MDAFKIYYLDTSQTGFPKHFVNIKAKSILDATIKFERWSSKVWRYGLNPFYIQEVKIVTLPKPKTITDILLAMLEN